MSLRRIFPKTALALDAMGLTEGCIEENQDLDRRLKALSEYCKRLETVNTQHIQNCERLTIEASEMKEELKKYQEENKALKKEISAEKERFDNWEKDNVKTEISEDKNRIDELETKFKNVEIENDEIRKMLEEEKEKNGDAFATIFVLRERIGQLKTEIERNEEVNEKYNILSEKVAHLAEEILEKEKDVPILGDNNIEELEIKKFVDFVTLHVGRLSDLIPNALDVASNQTTKKTCKICHKKTKFAKCFTENCEGIFHEDCIQRWFRTKQECPCCRLDSIMFDRDDHVQ